jgi:hypothetical protein
MEQNITHVMNDLEQKINPKTVNDGISKVVESLKTNNSSCLLTPMQEGAKEFEQRVGRPMTYSEMRSMWG